VRTEGAWEEWLAFSSKGWRPPRIRLRTRRDGFSVFPGRSTPHRRGRRRASVARVHELLQRQPMLSVKRARALLQDPPTFVTVNSAFSNRDPLVESNVWKEPANGHGENPRKGFSALAGNRPRSNRRRSQTVSGLSWRFRRRFSASFLPASRRYRSGWASADLVALMTDRVGADLPPRHDKHQTAQNTEVPAQAKIVGRGQRPRLHFASIPAPSQPLAQFADELVRLPPPARRFRA